MYSYRQLGPVPFKCIGVVQDIIPQNIALMKLKLHPPWANELTHYGRVLHIFISKLGPSPVCLQAIIWTNTRILEKKPSEIWIKIQKFSHKKIALKMLSAKGSHFVSATMCWCNLCLYVLTSLWKTYIWTFFQSSTTAGKAVLPCGPRPVGNLPNIFFCPPELGCRLRLEPTQMLTFDNQESQVYFLNDNFNYLVKILMECISKVWFCNH